MIRIDLSKRIALFASVIVALFITVILPASAQSTFTSANRSVTFFYPDKWKVTEDGGKIVINTDDGASYLVQQDLYPNIEVGEPSTSKTLRETSEAYAKTLLKNCEYAGVKLLTVGGGNGAVFRFRGVGAKSDFDLVEVYIGVFPGKKSLTIAQTASSVPDHSFELGVIFQNLNNKAAAPKEAAKEPVKKPGKPNTPDPATGTASTTNTPNPKKPVRSGEPAAPAGNSMLETYEGHLIANDLAFNLVLNHDKSATATWERTVGHPIGYSGSFTGTDGNYVVTLNANPGASVTPTTPLVITLRSMGGTITGETVMGTSTSKYPVQMLRLIAVDSGNIKLRGSAPTNTRPTMNRRRTASLPTTRSRKPRITRRIKILNPPMVSPPEMAT